MTLLKPLISSSSSSAFVTVLTPPQPKIYTPGDPLSGLVRLSLEREEKGNHRPKVERVTARLLCKMTTTIVTQYGTSAATKALHSEEQVLFPFPPPSDPALPPYDLDKATVDLPFDFQLPSQPLPPSLEGGTRLLKLRGTIQGHETARIIWFVLIVVKKAATLSLNEKHTLPFIFMPNAPSDIMVPFFLAAASPPYGTLPSVPPPSPALAEPTRWHTITCTQRLRSGGLFSSKQLSSIISLVLPKLDGADELILPLLETIPCYLSVTILGPPINPSSQIGSTAPSMPPIVLPSASDFKLELMRKIKASAYGQTERHLQRGGHLVDFSSPTSTKTWYLSPKLTTSDSTGTDEGGGKAGVTRRWAWEIVVMSEFVLGQGESMGCGVSIDEEMTLGKLRSGFFLHLSIPFAGFHNSFNEEKFAKLRILPPLTTAHDRSQPSRLSVLDGSSGKEVSVPSEMFPPSYFDLVDEDEKGDEDVEWGDDKKG